MFIKLLPFFLFFFIPNSFSLDDKTIPIYFAVYEPSSFRIGVSCSEDNFERSRFSNSISQNTWNKLDELQLLSLSPPHVLESHLQQEDSQCLFEKYHLYASPTYLNHIRSRCGYEQFILNLHEKIHSKHKFRKSLRHMIGFNGRNGFTDFIGIEACRIKREQAARDLQVQEKREKKKKIENERQEKQVIERQNQQSKESVDPKNIPELKNESYDWQHIPQEGQKEPIHTSGEEKQATHLYHSSESTLEDNFKNECVQRNLECLEQLSWDWMDAVDKAREVGNETIAQRYEDRLAALEQTANNPNEIVKFSDEIKITEEISNNFLHSELFEDSQGTILEKQLHKELLETVATTIDLQKENPNDFFVTTNIPIIQHFAALSKVQENIAIAFNLSDFCYHMTQMVGGYAKMAMDVVKDAGEKALKSAAAVGRGAAVVGRGVTDGAINYTVHSAKFVKNIVTKPLFTVQTDIINPLCKAAVSLGGALHLAFQDFDQFKNNAKETIQRTRNLIHLYPERAIAQITELLLPFGAGRLDLFRN